MKFSTKKSCIHETPESLSSYIYFCPMMMMKMNRLKKNMQCKEGLSNSWILPSHGDSTGRVYYHRGLTALFIRYKDQTGIEDQSTQEYSRL